MSDSIKWSSVVKEAQSDADFKDFLIANPRKAIEQITATELPNGVEFFVHEQRPNQVHLVLPFDAYAKASNSNGDGDDDKAVFVEPDDAGDKKAVFVEPDDAGDKKAVFVEPDDASDDKAVFVEPDDAGDKKAVFVEPDDANS